MNPSRDYMQGIALGAAVAALGLSNKAVYAEQAEESNAGVGSGMEGGSYTEGPDLAPNAAPSAVSGQANDLASHLLSLLSCMIDTMCRPTPIDVSVDLVCMANQEVVR